MELRQLRYFVEIANQGSYTRAAETLSIAQPGLTAQIHKLEAELSAQLFIRSKRGITLTPIGAMVREQAQRALDAADAAKRVAQFASEVAEAPLHVGFTRLCPFPPISRMVRELRRERPNVKVVLREMWSADQFDALENGALDVGFVHYTSTQKRPNLQFVPAGSDVMEAAVATGHRLATRRQIRLADLAEEGWIVPQYLGESVREVVGAACAREGFAPRVAQECSDVRILIGLVSAGLGVGVLSSSMREVSVRGVHFAPISPRIDVSFAAAYRRDATGKYIRSIIEAASD